jgi:hypothetical protein
MRLIAIVLVAGCATSPTDALMNGDDASSANSYWLSQQSCIVPFGQGFCSSKFGFQITADGNARFIVDGGSMTCGVPAPGTWQEIGATSFGLVGVCTQPGAQITSLTLTDVVGSKEDGFFTADVSGYDNNRFNLQLGAIP